MAETATPGWRNFLAGVIAVTATYVYFLLFAEFAFLRLIEPHLREPRLGLALLGAGGIAGSLFAASSFRRERFARDLAGAFLSCAAVALIARDLAGSAGALLTAFAVGTSVGSCTVTLASGLRALFGSARLGLGVGLGTGLAYAISNVPAIFAAPAETQAVISTLVAGAGGLAALAARPVFAETVTPRTSFQSARWIVALLALVWMDSAAFFIIQHTPALQSATWRGDAHLWGNAAVHLAAALLAGWLLDRARGRIAALAAWGLLAVACVGLMRASPPGAMSFFYAAGVSLYSAVLVYQPARTGSPWTAALTFMIAGWIGSALGIGMAQDLEGIPLLFVIMAGVAVGAALIPRFRGVALAVAVGGCLLVPRSLSAQPLDETERLGREIYIAEGCINCHSQYIRPHVALDVERWGPAAPLSELAADKPPLPGNRRQGPDLMNVGLRRSTAWHRLHLQDPRALNAGSRMPGYAHLFAAGDPRGEALVAYLASLGRDRAVERAEFIAAWQPHASDALAPAAAGKLFARLCSACHGPSGAGDGPLAARLPVRPPNWAAGEAWRFNAGDEAALIRIIKFGLAGTSMPGHEALDDAALRGLARHVQALHPSSPGKP